MYCRKCYVPPTQIGTDKDGNPLIRPAHAGRVFIDRIFSEKRHVELFCIICGARWMLDKEKSRFAAWLLAQEVAHAHAVTL